MLLLSLNYVPSIFRLLQIYVFLGYILGARCVVRMVRCARCVVLRVAAVLETGPWRTLRGAVRSAAQRARCSRAHVARYNLSSGSL